MLQFPAWVNLALAFIATAAGVVLMIPGMPPLVTQIAGAVVALCSAFGVMTPGARAAPPPVASPQAAADVLSLPPKS